MSHVQAHRSHAEQLVECVKAIALCHNVTPVLEEMGEGSSFGGEEEEAVVNDSDEEATVIFQRGNGTSKPTISYQASSPDEVRVYRSPWQQFSIAVIM